MKPIVSILIYLVGAFTIKAQTYKSDFRADMCDCLTEESLKRTLTENAYKACLRETLPKYATQIDAQIVEPDVNKKYYLGQIARKDLLLSMQSELIYSCEAYYKHLDYQRTSQKLIARENANESDLEKYDQMVALTPNAMAYFMRAQVQFKLGNIKATEADINKSLELNPNKENVKSTRHQLLLLAWVYEEQERYKEAVLLYDKIYFGELDIEVVKLRALADKKAGGTMANIPKAKDLKTKNEIKAVTRRSKTEGSKSSKAITAEPSKSSRSRTIKPKENKKKDTSSLRKLFKMGNG
ncbi:tetratricopeptide repeat protein [Winogradskyella eximia]|uniref:tetratricopeptide repeat protein n=1 Tax=Winogradskyella eximia TaxID=262006 RepID=UPI00248FE33C|nr:hypothetical protein [Winogradskyella eximia]